MVVKKSDNEFLFGKSNIYGEVAIPVASIQEINLGGFESDVFESKYDEWIIRSAKEFNDGAQSNSSLETANEN